MTNEKEQQKDDLFYKVSVGNLQAGFVAIVGIREYSVLSVIAAHADNEGKCYPSQETIAKACGVSVRTVIRLIDSLCEKEIDGKPILLRETKRKSEKVTKNYYTVTESAGMAFGINKVLTKLSRPKKAEFGDCEESSEGSDKIGNEVLTKLVEGTDKIVTLTKAINKSHLTKSNIEQEEEKAASLSEKKNDSSKDNNMNNIVEVKDSNILVEESEGKRISFLIVANGRRKNEIKEDQSTDSHGTDTASKQPTKGESLSAEETRKEAAETPQESKPLSLRQIMLERDEMNRKEQERKRAAYVEEQKRKTRELNGTGVGHTASKDRSEGNRPSVQTKPVTGQNNALDALSIDDILSMPEDDLRKIVQ